jgi:hypothetical protein
LPINSLASLIAGSRKDDRESFLKDGLDILEVVLVIIGSCRADKLSLHQLDPRKNGDVIGN